METRLLTIPCNIACSYCPVDIVNGLVVYIAIEVILFACVGMIVERFETESLYLTRERCTGITLESKGDYLKVASAIRGSDWWREI